MSYYSRTYVEQVVSCSECGCRMELDDDCDVYFCTGCPNARQRWEVVS